MSEEGRNLVILLGRLGADPELRFGQGENSAVLKLRVATTESYFDKRSNERKERTDWHSVVLFGKRGESLQKIVTKGDRVYVEGRLSTRTYDKDGEKRYTTEVVAEDIILCGGGGGGGGDERQAPATRAARAPAQLPDRPNFGRQPAPAPVQQSTNPGYPPDWDDPATDPEAWQR